MNESLATNSKLKKETFDDFVTRLRHDCVGDGVKEHYTANAIFTVQAKTPIYGMEADYADAIAIFIESDEDCNSPDEFYDSEEDYQQELDVAADLMETGKAFKDLDYSEKLEILKEVEGIRIVGLVWRWVHVNSHFTRDAAEAFIARKKHDYKHGLRVYVDAQTYCGEFEAIKAGLLNGSIKFEEQEK